MTEAWRVGARAGGPQWGGSAGGPGTVFIAAHRDPSELQARSGYVADTGAAGRASQGSICGRWGVLRRRPLGPGLSLPRPAPSPSPAQQWKQVSASGIDLFNPDSLQSPQKYVPNVKSIFEKVAPESTQA